MMMMRRVMTTGVCPASTMERLLSQQVLSSLWSDDKHRIDHRNAFHHNGTRAVTVHPKRNASVFFTEGRRGYRYNFLVNHQSNVVGTRYFNSTTIAKATSDDGTMNKDHDGLPPPPQQEQEPRLLYRAPMGGLVSRLKRISITSCLISIIGLPMLIYLKNGTWPDAKQIGMGGFAFVSATGSTMALHFVFGPYVLDLCEIPVRKCHSPPPPLPVDDDDVNSNMEESPTSAVSPNNNMCGQEFLYKATTRSILGMTNEVVFNPLTDITRYQGARPFANFVVKNEFVLYCHPELLDDETRRKLLHPHDPNASDTDKDNTTKDEKNKIRRPVDEDDGLL